MRFGVCTFAAAALAVAGVGLSPQAFGQASGQQEAGGPAGAPGQAGRGGSAGAQPGLGEGASGIGRTGDRPGGVATELGAGAQDAHFADVRFIIARVADASLSVGGSTQLLAYLSEPDRQRLSGEIDPQDPQMRQHIEQLNQIWRQRYNREFEIGTQRLAFDQTNVRIIEGGLDDSARMAGEQVGQAGAGAATDAGAATGAGAGGGEPGSLGRTNATDTAGAIGAGPQTGTAGGTGEATPAGEIPPTGGVHGTGAAGAADPAADVGIGASARGDIAASSERMSVVIPQADHAPAIVLHLTREAGIDGAWKIVLPEQIDAQTLQTNLRRQVGLITAAPERLPESEEQAYVLVAQHVLAALTDASATEQPKDVQPAPDEPDRDTTRPGEPNALPGLNTSTPGTPAQPAQPDVPGDGRGAAPR